MKTFLPYLLLIISTLFYSSCERLGLAKEKDNELNGDAAIELNTIGNTFGSSCYIGDSSVEINEEISVAKNDNGIITYNIKADIPKDNPLFSLIPASAYDVNGKLNTEIKMKVTSEGIQTFFNNDQAQTLVKHDCKVGDSWSFTKTNGKTITRTVTQKSTTDDFAWGFYLIKTTTIEQDSEIPGVSKMIVKTNHKYGIVYFEAIMEDGTHAYSFVFPRKPD